MANINKKAKKLSTPLIDTSKPSKYLSTGGATANGAHDSFDDIDVVHTTPSTTTSHAASPPQSAHPLPYQTFDISMAAHSPPPAAPPPHSSKLTQCLLSLSLGVSGAVMITISTLAYHQDIDMLFTVSVSNLVLLVSIGACLILTAAYTLIMCCCTCPCPLQGIHVFALSSGAVCVALSCLGFLHQFGYRHSLAFLRDIQYPLWQNITLAVYPALLVLLWLTFKWAPPDVLHAIDVDLDITENDTHAEAGAESADTPSYLQQKTGRLHPYDRSWWACLWHSFTHQWLWSIIALGARQPLQIHDLYDVPRADHMLTSVRAWDNIIHAQQQNPDTKTKHFSTRRVLWQIEGRAFVIRNVVYFAALLTSLTVPFIISALSDFYEHEGSALETGVWLAIALWVVAFIRIEIVSYIFTTVGRSMSRVRALLMYVIYRRALFGTLRDDDTSIGAKITMLGADSRMIAMALSFMHFAIANMALAVLICFLLFAELGSAAFIGWVFFMLVSGPVQAWIGGKVHGASKAYIGHSDVRVKFIGELIRGIQITKFYCWERALLDQVFTHRCREMEQLLIRVRYSAILNMMNIATPHLMILMMLGVYVMLGNALTLSTTFAVITLVQLLRISIRVIPFAIMLMVGAYVSLQRLDKFFASQSNSSRKLDGDDRRRMQVQETGDERVIVRMLDATFAWTESKQEDEDAEDADDKEGETNGIAVNEELDDAYNSFDTSTHLSFHDHSFQQHEQVDIAGDVDPNHGQPLNQEFRLQNMTITLERGKLYGLVGKVGSGKSSLIQSILGETILASGRFEMNAEVQNECIGYFAQKPFIINATVRENILFGMHYDETFYMQCVAAAALPDDLNMLANGDLTEIGERGITLSGGQKARICFARALYRKRLIHLYLLDDPLSAVDVHVGDTMFHEGILHLLADKTRVMVMNSHLDKLQFMDEIIIMDAGRIAYKGSYKNVMSNRKYLHLLPTSEDTETDSHDDDDDDGDDDDDAAADQKDMRPKSKHVTANSLLAQSTVNLKNRAQPDSDKGALMSKEDRGVGTIKFSVYSRYFSNAADMFDHRSRDQSLNVESTQDTKSKTSVRGVLLILLEVFLLITAQTLSSVSDIWLSFWAEEDDRNRYGRPDEVWWLTRWSVIIALLTVFSFFGSFLFGKLSLRAAQSLHMKSLFFVLRAPMSYFNATPTGRILNRFSKDTNEMDDELINNFNRFSQDFLMVAGYIIVIVISNFYTLFVLILMLPILYWLQKFYRPSSRDLKRMTQITLTPIITQFNETLLGLDSIRSYKLESYFLRKLVQKNNDNHKVFLTEQMALRWFGICMDLVVAIFIFVVALSATFLRTQFPPAMLSLSVVYGYGLMGMLQWALSASVDVEKNFTSIERLLYFEDIASEATEINQEYRPAMMSGTWPNRGVVNVDRLCLRYRQNLDFVLHNLKFTINEGEKVGVVGRTGAGKSSLFKALFRTVEPERGTAINIDGVDCLKLGLYDLRSNLSIIPQDPVLFSGTLRFNLDPFEKHSDDEIWRILQMCEMKQFIQAKPDMLQCAVKEDGANFSQGQKQLICIGRALLKKSKILLLDEATSSVDKYNDTLIQKLIREQFKDRTVLCIAHRLETIMDYDKIMVLSAGQIIEYDAPQKLLSKSENDLNAIFKSMVQNELKKKK